MTTTDLDVGCFVVYVNFQNGVLVKQDDKLKIKLSSLDDGQILVFRIDEKNIIVPALKTKDGVCFDCELEINVLKDDSTGKLYVKYPQNSLLGIVANRDEIGLEFWEFAMIIQDDKAYFSAQKLPFLIKLVNFVEIIPEELKNEIIDLLNKSYNYEVQLPYLTWWHLRNFIYNPDTNTYKKEKMDPGRVIWYNPASGIGCIQTEKGEALVRWDELPEREFSSSFPPHPLHWGEKVSYRILVKLKNPCPSFEWEAKGISVCR